MGFDEGIFTLDSKTLFLSWPDYSGNGKFGLTCVQKWLEFFNKVQGVEREELRLILVGEWRNSQTDMANPRIPHFPGHGQSFSLEMQEYVEKEFELEKSIDIPNWPLTCDKMWVWTRRNKNSR